MQKIHNNLKRNLPWYDKWHDHPRHQHAHWLIFVSVGLMITSYILSQALVLFLDGENKARAASNIQFYGHYFVEDDGKNLRYVDEVAPFTNIINVRWESGPNNKLGPDNASRILDAGVKVMLQLPFGSDTDQTLFVDASAREAYLQDVKNHLNSLNFMQAVAYIAIYEEWFVLIKQDYYKWPIFQGKTLDQKLATANLYLTQIINDIHRIFPGIPTVIVDNVPSELLNGPFYPNNLDVYGVDAYYIPDNSSCDSTQRAKFESEVLPWFESAKRYGKPIMMVPPSFVLGPWKMLSECQMQWYADLAVSGNYNITSFIWFTYGSFEGLTGVRNYPDLVDYQKRIACQLLGNPYCGTIKYTAPSCDAAICGRYNANPEGRGPAVILDYTIP
jgi:hypothetical protein